jgi:DNA repair ATPase RecN
VNGLDDLWNGVKSGATRALKGLEAWQKADPQLIEVVQTRLDEQDRWNDVFSTKLIELLDKNDAIRSEIKKRLIQIENACRCQEELTRAADEHRLIASEYQAVASALSLARDKFERAESIKIEASGLLRAVKGLRRGRGQTCGSP